MGKKPATIGLPGLFAYLVFAIEAIGGVMLIVGFRTRLVALLLTPVLLGAAWVHWPNGWLFNAPNGGWEYPVFLAASSLAVVLLGDGAYSIGRLRNNVTVVRQSPGVS